MIATAFGFGSNFSLLSLLFSLASVQAFRTEVLKKASSNVFENLTSKPDNTHFSCKKSEFPCHLPQRHGSGDLLKKMLPAKAELGSVPETQEISMSFRRKLSERDSKADSGIVSGSDLEGYDSGKSDSSRSLSLDAELTEDDPARLSVSAKAFIFKTISEKKAEKSASGAKRYIDRKKRERSRTLPVTDDEVHSAAEIADDDENADNKAVLEVDEKGEHDEKSK